MKSGGSSCDSCRSGIPVAPIFPGTDIRKQMRRHQVTIKELSERLQVSERRVRDARRWGVGCYVCSCGWWEAITGEHVFSLRLYRLLTRVMVKEDRAA